MRAVKALGVITCIAVGAGLFVYLSLSLTLGASCFDVCQPDLSFGLLGFAARWLGPGVALALALWLWEAVTWRERARQVWTHQPLILLVCGALTAGLVIAALTIGRPPSQSEPGVGPYALALAALIVGVWAFAVGWYGARGPEPRYQPPALP